MNWIAVASGVLVLSTTKFRIVYTRHADRADTFDLTWDGGIATEFPTLAIAKLAAREKMNDLIGMGIEV